MTTRITKLHDKHFQGFTCDCCEREIKHAYSINGVGTYGSECVYREAGIPRQKAGIMMREANSIAKYWNKIVSNPKMYDLQAYLDSYNCTADEYYNIFVERGGRLA